MPGWKVRAPRTLRSSCVHHSPLVISAELFLVELLGEAGEGVRGRFWLSVREKGVSLLDHASKEMKWEWSLADVQEFTLEACMGHKRLTIKVEKWVMLFAAVASVCMQGMLLFDWSISGAAVGHSRVCTVWLGRTLPWRLWS